MDLFALQPSVLIATTTAAIIVFLLFRHKHAPPSNPTGLKSYPIVGNISHFIRNRRRLLDWVTDLISASPTGTVTVAPFVFTANPSNVQHTTVSRFPNYTKTRDSITTLHDFLGDGIFNADGPRWMSQRKAASFHFSTRSLRSSLHTLQTDISTDLTPLLARAAAAGELLDLQGVLDRFAFNGACSLVLGERRSGRDGDRFYRAFEQATHLSIKRWDYPFHSWKLLRFLNVGPERRLEAALSTLKEYIPTSSSDHCFLVNLLLAAHETTPSALTWFFWVVSGRPDVVGKILDEVRSVRRRSGGQELGLDEVREMQYLKAALSESMRLYPPVPLHVKECAEDDELPDGTAVRRGWRVGYSAYAMGRAEGIWGADWAEFRPERWMEEGTYRARSVFEYPVFHAGPRLCLGREMAYAQMKAVVVGVLERFEVEVVEERGRHQLSMTMRMVGGLPVRVRERRGGGRQGV